MPSAKQLREEAGVLAKEINALAEVAQTREFNAEEKEKWERVNREYDSAVARAKAIERGDATRAEMTSPADPTAGGLGRANLDPRTAAAEHADRLRTLAIAGWLMAPDFEGPTPEQREAMAAVGVHPQQKGLKIGLYGTDDFSRLQRQFRSHHPSVAADRCRDFRATMTSGSGPTGGYALAPEQLRASLEINMLAFGGVRQVAETIRTATGEGLNWPNADDTGNTGSQIGESTDVSNSGAGGNDVTLGMQTWGAYDFSSNMILVPKNLLRDSWFNLGAVLGQMLGERLGRITNTKQTTGTGAATMKGIVVCATTFSAASATAIAFDDCIKLEHSVDPAYRNLPGTGYMLHDSILLALRLLKDGNGQYLWKSNEPAGRSDTLNNRPYTINQDMDSTIASGKKTLLFGHMPSYKIRTVGDIELLRLDERYAEYRRVAFVAFTSEDAKLLNTATPRMKVLTH